MTSAEGAADTILAAIQRLAHGSDEHLSVRELVTRLGPRAPALMLFLLAAVNLTPGPSIPFFSTLFAVPLCIVAAEMMLGRHALRLPRFIAEMKITRSRVEALVRKIEPLLQRVDRVLRPRHRKLGDGVARAMGAVCLILGLVLALPIPVFSMLPAASVMAISLGLLARDFWALIVGIALGVLSLAVLGGLVVAVEMLHIG